MKCRMVYLRIPRREDFEFPENCILLMSLDDRTEPTKYMRTYVAMPVDKIPTIPASMILPPEEEEEVIELLRLQRLSL